MVVRLIANPHSLGHDTAIVQILCQHFLFRNVNLRQTVYTSSVPSHEFFVQTWHGQQPDRPAIIGTFWGRKVFDVVSKTQPGWKEAENISFYAFQMKCCERLIHTSRKFHLFGMTNASVCERYLLYEWVSRMVELHVACLCWCHDFSNNILTAAIKARFRLDLSFGLCHVTTDSIISCINYIKDRRS